MPHAAMYSHDQRFQRNSMPAPPLPGYIPEKTGQPLRHLLQRKAGDAIHAPKTQHEWLILTACASMLFAVLLLTVCMAVLLRWHRRMHMLELQSSRRVANKHGDHHHDSDILKNITTKPVPRAILAQES